ncbi:MAG TPA: FAD/NAD(P)-binding oxidoreductase, partial [Thermodesulfobacteriota bacterium]|nr:FAD/NAD(P)-binding oxidoreductase [Thermodesulfobacteriota bacterium]
EEKLFLYKKEEDPLLRIRTNARVSSVDGKSRSIILESGEKISYERLILAPGGKPIVPRFITETGLEGIFPVRNLPEAEKVRQWAAKDRRIVILGGGLVGVKTAAYLRKAGFPVAIVEKEDRILPQALSSRAAVFPADHLRACGVELFLGQTLKSLHGEGGKIAAVEVAGKKVPCGTLLVSAGSVPNVSFLENSGLLGSGAISVSPALQTKDPRIFAVGDAVIVNTADGKKYTPWTWPQAVAQGKLAAMNLYRSEPVPLRILTRVNSMNLQPLALNMLGAATEGSEEVSFKSPDGAAFRQLFMREGRIAGGALIGNIAGAGALHYRFVDGGPVDASEVVAPVCRGVRQEYAAAGTRRRRALFIRKQE